MARESIRFPLRSLVLISIIAATPALPGCGDSSGAVPVSGKVTYQGKPVTGEINFVPDGAATRAAHGLLDASGYYRLTMFSPNDGAIPGKYKVAVISRGPDKPVPAKKKGKMMEEDMEGSGDALIPKQYLDAETSGLSAEVKSGGNNTFDFELK